MPSTTHCKTHIYMKGIHLLVIILSCLFDLIEYKYLNQCDNENLGKFRIQSYTTNLEYNKAFMNLSLAFECECWL